MLADIFVILPSLARQGLRYEINGLGDDPVYVNGWDDVVKTIKAAFPRAKKVAVVSDAGSVDSVPLEG